MEYKVEIGGKVITLFHDNMDESINVDDLTKIDSSNLYGEAVTISAAMNRIGLLKAELESHLAESKLDLRIFEADFVAKKRKEAANNGNQFTLRGGNEDVKITQTEKA